MNEFHFYLASLLSLAILWFQLFWAYNDFRVDQFRQQMFELRDQMFDDARNGLVSFDDEAYGIIRITMNGMVRYAHLISLSHVLLFRLIRPNSRSLPSFRDRLGESLKTASPQRKSRYDSYVKRMNQIVARHIVLNSPILIVTVLIPAAVIIAATSFVDRLISNFKEPIDRIDSFAYAAADPN